MAPITSTAPKVVINYIHGGTIDEKYNSKRKKQRLLYAASVQEQVISIQPGLPPGGTHLIDGVITFPPVDHNWVLQPHEDALILTLGTNDFDVRWILVDPGSSADLFRCLHLNKWDSCHPL